ncbi:nucleoside-diphosphate kinase, partial [Candidatus Woesearchaeota archaeon]|nr:nucleoside-diphosphate kinase [Candidatus Woesearchaeota archaeon]
MIEKTLVLIKPDGLQRGLIGEITKRFERKGLKLVGLKMMHLDDPILDKHYEHHANKPFFDSLKSFMKSSPIVAQVWEGVECISAVRIIAGVTKASEADAGTIRGDLAMSVSNNVVHCSDSLESAKKEIDTFFKKGEVFSYDKSEWTHVYDLDEL